MSQRLIRVCRSSTIQRTYQHTIEMDANLTNLDSWWSGGRQSPSLLITISRTTEVIRKRAQLCSDNGEWTITPRDTITIKALEEAGFDKTPGCLDLPDAVVATRTVGAMLSGYYLVVSGLLPGTCCVPAVLCPTQSATVSCCTGLLGTELCTGISGQREICQVEAIMQKLFLVVWRKMYVSRTNLEEYPKCGINVM